MTGSLIIFWHSKKLDVNMSPFGVGLTDNILALKKNRRKHESIWRRSRLTIHFDLYKESCKAVKQAIIESKAKITQLKIIDCNGNQKKLFKIVDPLLGRNKTTVLPEYSDPATLASNINTFFIDKIDKIRTEFPLLEVDLPPFSLVDMDSIMPICTASLDYFDIVTVEELTKIISCMNKTTCKSDPFQTKLLFSHLPSIISIILHIINLCLTSGIFPQSCKSSIVLPLIKKTGLDQEILKNYRPVSNLSFLSKVIEKVILVRILKHIEANGINDNFQSAYMSGHSCETALIRVYNDIVTTIGKGNGSGLVLLDLSAAFDTIDHENLFNHLEKYVGISGDALKLIKSYFSGQTQRVMNDGILSDVASLICGVPQGSVLGPLKFCLYLLPLVAILRYHNIAYHVYADGTQLYISFNNKDPSGPLARLNSCISDIRVWMIKNKLKINDSKTEFIIFRSPQCKASISGVSVSVGDSNILPSPKVRDLGVIFDECLTLDAHIGNIYRRAHFHLKNIGKIRMLLSFEASSQLIHALITTTLDYCNGILSNL